MSMSPRSLGELPPRVNLDSYCSRWGSARQHVNRLQELIKDHISLGHDPQLLRPHLLNQIADLRNLRVAWQHLAQLGGDAPGPNGLGYADLSSREVISVLRQLSDLILSGFYRPGPERRVSIPKSSGRGTRILTLQNIQDRVVARACQQVLHPLLTGQFCQQRLTACANRDVLLAIAESLVQDRGYVHTVKCDIRDAFDHVPQRRLLQILPRYVPAEAVCELIQRIIATESSRGIRQGSPLSPLLLDAYLDHFLVRRWQREFPNTPLLKYADDILILSQSHGEAATASQRLGEMLRDCGFTKRTEPVANLTVGTQVEWLGMGMRLDEGRLVIAPGQHVWTQLEEHLADAQSQIGASRLAHQIVFGWINQLGPCFLSMDRPATYREFERIAAKQGFDELTYEELLHAWHAAHERWLQIPV